MIIALIKKELREHFPIAAFGLLAAAYAALSAAGTEYFGETTIPVPLLDREYLSWLALIAGGVGALLGFAMSWKEEFRRTWPFLLQRPVSRAQVLAGKWLAAGLLLALVLAPYWVLACWAALPGKYPAPWSATYLLPGVLVTLLAAGAFLAAFACGLRSARWYATRFTPLAATGLLVAVLYATPRWDATLLLAVVGALLLAAAAWAEWRPRGPAGVGAALVHTVGISVFLAIGALLALGLLATVLRPPAPEPPDLNRVTQWVEFSRSGEPWIVGRDRANACLSLADAEGNTLDTKQFKDEELARSVSLRPLADTGVTRANTWAIGTRSFPVSRCEDWRSIRVMPPESYRYRLPDGRVVEFDAKSRRPSAAWGVNGFFRDPRQAVGFGPAARCVGDYVFSEAGIFRLASGRTVRLHDQPAYFYCTLGQGNSGLERSPYDALLVTATEILAYDRQSDAPSRFALPPALNQTQHFGCPPELLTFKRNLGFGVRLLANGGLVLHTQERRPAAGTEGSEWQHRAWAFDPKGTLLWRKGFVRPALANAKRWLPLTLPESRLGERAVVLAALYCVQAQAGRVETLTVRLGRGTLYGCLSSPASIGMLVAKLGLTGWLTSENRQLAANYWRYEAPALPVLVWLALLLATSGSAALAWLFLRRRGRSRAACLGWTLFALLGGLPALLVVIALNGGEARLPCPACGAQRYPSQPACPTCAAPWPPPARRDTDLLPAG